VTLQGGADIGVRAAAWDRRMAKAKKEAPEAPAEGAEGAEKPAKKKRGLVKTLLMFGLPVLLVLGGAAYFFLFMGGEEVAEGEHGAEHAEAAPPPVFVDLPDMLVNLTAAGGERAILKLVVALEVKDAEVAAAIDPVMPRVIDNFQVFLRELRVEDLSGSAGMFRLKEELVRRVNLAVAPSQVSDVLFKEMLIQ
jgi:flagellar FliL protein